MVFEVTLYLKWKKRYTSSEKNHVPSRRRRRRYGLLITHLPNSIIDSSTLTRYVFQTFLQRLFSEFK